MSMMVKACVTFLIIAVFALFWLLSLCRKAIDNEPFDMKQMLERMSADRWGLVSTHQPNLAHLYLFFTRKKIKNYYY